MSFRRTGFGIPAGCIGGPDSQQSTPTFGGTPETGHFANILGGEARLAARRIIRPADISNIIDPARQPMPLPTSHPKDGNQSE